MCWRSVVALVLLLASGATSRAQDVIKVDRVGLGGSEPSGTSAIIATPASIPATTGSDNYVYIDSSGLFRKGALSIPSTYLQRHLDEAITGVFDFQNGLRAASIRASSASPFNIRNLGNTATIAAFGDAAITLSQPTTITGNSSVTGTWGVTGLSTLTGGFTAGAASQVNSTLGVTGLSTLTGGFSAGAASSVNGNLSILNANDLITGTGGIRTSSGTVDIRNIADTATIAAFGDASITFSQPLQINATLGVTGLTTLADVQSSGYRGTVDPFTVEATDGTTALLRAYNSGRTWIGNTGTDTYWEYNATGNPSGQRVWRAGLIGGNFRVEAGNDAASSWSTLFRSTMSSGIPNGIYWGTGVSEVSPDQDFQTNLGNFGAQYANLWVRNLWSTTLVAQDLISTIGGAVNVAPTTTLEADITSGSTTILTAHNEMVSGDIGYMNANLATEFIQITSNPIAASSSVSFIGANEAVGTTVTLPAHQAGDLLLIFAFRNATTAPTLPADWNNITNCNGSGNGTSVRVGYRIATASGTTSGTWTNATSLMAHVYRSTTGLASAPGACALGSASASTSLVYPALTLTKTDHSSWVARAAMASAGTNIQTAPTGYTLRSNNTAVPESASFDSNGRITATSVAASSALTITSGNWRTVSVEIVGIGLGPFSYTVTRGYGGVFAARAWESGTGLMNTGTTGDGFINMYAIQSIKGSGEQGPTIAGNVRTSTTYNGWSTRWALGNLRNLYNYGASDVYGAAFGNVSDVWLGVDTVGGVRFWDAGTTQTAQFALDGSILLGQTGAGQANTLITPTNFKIRRGTVDGIDLSSAGLQMYDTSGVRRVLLDTGGLVLGTTGAGEENVLISPTNVAMRIATTPYIYANSSDGAVVGTPGVAGISWINAAMSGTLNINNGSTTRIQLAGSNGNLSLNDASGTTRATFSSAGWIQLGTSGSGEENIYVDSTQLLLRQGGVERLNISGSAIYMRDEAGSNIFYVDQANGIILGDWYTSGANKNFLQITTTAMAFCRTGVGCPLVFSGATGDITSTGNILLSTGGKITSTGNFTLGNAEGMSFQIGTSSSGFDAPRTIRFLSGTTEYGAIGTRSTEAMYLQSYRTGAGKGIRLAIGSTSTFASQETGLFITAEGSNPTILNIVAQQWSGSIGHNLEVQFVPFMTTPTGTMTSRLGTAANQWSEIRGVNFYANGTIGWSGNCATTVVVSGGIVTGCI